MSGECYAEQVPPTRFGPVALINACHSGSFGVASFGDAAERRLLPKAPGSHIITAGATNELTWHLGSVGPGSLFFEKVLGGLGGWADSQPVQANGDRGDGVVTATELYDYVRQEILIETEQKQHPKLVFFDREKTGSFFFLNRGRQVAAETVPVWDKLKWKSFGFNETGKVERASRKPEPGDRWVEPVNGMAFRYIPAGRFQMGSPEGEPGRRDNETLHAVTLTRNYWLGETEVTQGQWERLMGNNPSRFAECGADCPVESVSWFEAAAFANRLSEEAKLPACYEMRDCKGTLGGGLPDGETYGTGDYQCGEVVFAGLACRGYRLPTEAEWERAARGDSEKQTPIYTGGLTLRGANDGPELDEIAWYGGNSGVDYMGGFDCSGWEEKQYPEQKICGTHAVGGRRANDWRLHDMLGNVYEWTWDWYGAYPAAQVEDPLGSENASFRVLRGCGWITDARKCRAAYRIYDSPAWRYDFVGFRLARLAD